MALCAGKLGEAMSFFTRHIRTNFDQAFFERVPEAIEGACAIAHSRSRLNGDFLQYHVPLVEGNERHYAIQAAFIDLSIRLGAQEYILKARNYPIYAAKHRRFILTAHVADNLNQLSRSKARRYLASLNGALEPFQYDLFNPEPLTTANPIFGMIIVAKARNSAVPAGIYFGVPTSTLRGWHFYAEISDVFALYNSAEKLDIPLAMRRKPRLRRTPRSRTLPRPKYRD